MSSASLSPSLRHALLLDALASGLTAILLLVGAPLLADLTGLPPALLRVAGAILIPFVGFVVWTAIANGEGAAAIRAIIVCNIPWVVASAVLLLGSWVEPTALGNAFVIAQAVVVGMFAEAQLLGLRRARALAAPERAAASTGGAR